MPSILIAEDSLDLAVIMAAALRRAGHEVTAVGDGRAALAHLRRDAGRFALLVSDLVMPECEGIETIREARCAAPALPILAISGAGEASIYLRSARALGATASLAKPFSAEEFLATCQRLLEPCTTSR